MQSQFPSIPKCSDRIASVDAFALRQTVSVQNRASEAKLRVDSQLDQMREERGEGVISVALAVLIMAALAALMWVAYKTMWDDASTRTGNEIKKIGSGATGATGAGNGL